ncbi:peptide-methionine (S)-S-oxide reductase [Leptospira ognonensis]|uniref:Peptide methionine sulfoxide reductase MsrA n=2 Tax=Leptospira ognonensis TaxID=2484945 RepID=A0A4R9K4V9_9LEPT|nr:peptide-methionine (S)-S-oxide reductase [Leptospira ognonensis]
MSMIRKKLPMPSFFLFLLLSCSAFSENNNIVKTLPLTAPNGKAIAAFAEGCFWCSEHIFESVYGVEEAISGYAGGITENPTYETVNTETTEHAETVYVIYDPTKISYKELCRVFFTSHDPTTKDRQGPDSGSSYRSILFYITENEKLEAESVLKETSQSKRFKSPIVTEIKKLNAFYQAEGYHQDFIRKNPNQSYVVNVSIPRYELFRNTYKGKLKD